MLFFGATSAYPISSNGDLYKGTGGTTISCLQNFVSFEALNDDN